MTRHNRLPEDPWAECPPGTVRQLQHRMKSKRRQEVWRQVAVSAALVGLVLVGAWSMQRALVPGSLGPGGVSCEFVLLNLDAYSAGELSLEQQASVGKHLQLCAPCRAKMDAMARQPVRMGAGTIQTAGNSTQAGRLAMFHETNVGHGYPPHRPTLSINLN